ncbi:MFS transporter [Blastopirellula sp. JC732]|uniref:MFS transporter n=1 Tax=Blastopirellula sediminis TaxID=2894196 RepID=A0A9X1MNQ4_9BACT|nr:MFS transporter [Blastopirellula sediminis]MCC9606168.1 MFS transporter [Blastopirellula sediminis]MCC9630533.1 MFS transporter [Blastopirellula sediminis]
MDSPSPASRPWYHEVTRYQWLVLIIASAGWVFDVYEGQIFNITRNQMLSDIVPNAEANVKWYGDFFLAIFLFGGTVGGLLAGTLADRFGRRPIMIATILAYSVFSGLTFFATELWHVAILRFLVAVGVGGEWAVAASLVAEVFPPKARAQASGIFHSTSILGTWLAALAGLAVGVNWQYAYLVGILPALLIVWVRSAVQEPERWQEKKDAAKSSTGPEKLGSFRQLLLASPWSFRAFMGMGLAAVGLGTFWAVTVSGQDLMRELLLRNDVSPEGASQQAKFAYGIVQAAGGGIGLLSFGPLAARFGRKPAFIFFQLAALAIVPIVCYLPQTYWQLLFLLPFFGFFTLGIHAGYAIYFPELFPTHLRATGTSFCFNGGRVVAVPVLLTAGTLKSEIDLRLAVSLLALLFLVGVVIMLFLPETKGQELPE